MQTKVRHDGTIPDLMSRSFWEQNCELLNQNEVHSTRAECLHALTTRVPHCAQNVKQLRAPRLPALRFYYSDWNPQNICFGQMDQVNLISECQKGNQVYVPQFLSHTASSQLLSPRSV